MTLSYTIHTSHSLAVVRHSGVIEDAEFVEAYRRLYDDPRYRLGMDEIADLRDVTDFRVSSDALRDVERIVEDRYEGTGETLRTAIVAPDDLPYAVARIYDALAAGGPEVVSVFRDLQSALTWLDLGDVLSELRSDFGEAAHNDG